VNEPDLKLADTLAIDRTRMAAERSLMAWVRTALSMITFGFTFYKFMQFLQEQSKEPLVRPQSPRNLAIALIGIGTLALILVLCHS
jgi:putative membrane protein